VYNHVTFSWQGYHDKEESFGEPPFIDIAVAQPAFQFISNELAELFLSPEEIAIEKATSEADNVKVVELRESFWRKVNEISPNGYYEYNGYSVTV
jgi:hypothetical protein